MLVVPFSLLGLAVSDPVLRLILSRCISYLEKEPDMTVCAATAAQEGVCSCMHTFFSVHKLFQNFARSEVRSYSYCKTIKCTYYM